MTHDDTAPTTSANQPDTAELWASLERPLPQWFAQSSIQELSPSRGPDQGRLRGLEGNL